MAGRNCADIVFCIDASGSMKPCLDAVRENIEKLLEGLQTDVQTTWDVRFDFLAFHDSKDGVHWYRSVALPTCPLIDAIYKGEGRTSLFTKDLAAFKAGLKEIAVEGEEDQMLALDIAMDFPWRPSNGCHRVVVLLTDESVETGVAVGEQKAKIDALIAKAMDKRIKLFVVAPESESFYRLSAADRCEYDDSVAERGGLRNVDFSKMMTAIGKSVSVAQTYDGATSEPRPNFDQLEWSATDRVDWGVDS